MVLCVDDGAIHSSRCGTQRVFSVPKPGDGQSGVEASCGSALKDILIRVYRSGSEPIKTWQQRLRQALEAMGAEAAAASAQRHLDRAAARCEPDSSDTSRVVMLMGWEGTVRVISASKASSMLVGGACFVSFSAGRGLQEKALEEAQAWLMSSRTYTDRVTSHGHETAGFATRSYSDIQPQS